MRWPFFPVCALSAALAAPQAASAQVSDEAGYRALIDNGIREFAGGNYPEALASFLQAQQIRPGARVLRGIAKTRFELRQYSACIDAIDAALQTAYDPMTPEMRGEMAALRQRALGYVGQITLRVSPANARVVMDGQTLPSSLYGVPFRADIGRHTFEVSAEGFSTANRSVDVQAGGDTQLVVVALVAGQSNPLFVGSLVTGILSVGGVVGSALWWIDRSAEADRCQEAFDNGARCANADALGQERNLSLGVLIGTSALAVASGIALGVSLRGRPTGTPPLSALCVPSPGGGACAGVLRW